ncbi:hypothetical protein COO59_11010 [Mixta theicola]|uniref:DUF943 domain-containing protein n=1 Tax=Mixta theicola TaxID=1458355 RepID=A0A2K1Q935_9GAMM|nr:hypothetical protein COO59_11010 [Mixta theicola]
MNCRLKVFLILLASVFIAVIIGVVYLSCQLINIVATHQYYSRSDILVNRFPWTDKGKIKWWENNKLFFPK